MKFRISYLLLPVALVLSTMSPASAVAKSGSPCNTLSQFQKTTQGLLVCDLIKKKKIWRKATGVEATFYKNDQLRIQEEQQKKLDEAAKAETDRIAQEAKAAADKAAADKAAADKAAADKAAADKAAADKAAADKAAADKAAADKAAADKAAADKAAADKAAAYKAAADKAAADKAAADKAAADKAAAAEVPKLVVGGTYFGQDVDHPEWNWVAIRVTNSASTKMFSHQFFDVLLADATGGIIDSSFSTNFPILGPGQSAWYTTTEFNSKPISQSVFQQKYSTTSSPLALSELPTATNAHLVTSSYYASRKMIAFTVRNNSSKVLSEGTKCFAVLLNSSNTPVYAIWGRMGKSVLPGGSAEVTIGSDFTFNGQYSSIEISLGPQFP
jgi:flagellar hook-length control protein FliK